MSTFTSSSVGKPCRLALGEWPYDTVGRITHVDRDEVTVLCRFGGASAPFDAVSILTEKEYDEEKKNIEQLARRRRVKRYAINHNKAKNKK